MKAIIYQTAPNLLDVNSNLDDIINKIIYGKGRDADLIVFPELALTGYFVGQHYHEAALRLDSKEIKRLADATHGCAAVVGFIEESPSMNFYNSALVAVNGEILFAYRKLNLPSYGVFEERKMFSPGKNVQVFKVNDYNIAVFICNDLWHPSIPYLGITQKADIFVSIFNSSQGSMGDDFSNIETWGVINSFYSRVFGIYNICANRVGEETYEERNNPTNPLRKKTKAEENMESSCTKKTFRFWGGSEILNPFGKPVAKAMLYEPDDISGVIERDLLRKKKILLPYLKNDDPYFTHRELQRVLYRKSYPNTQ